MSKQTTLAIDFGTSRTKVAYFDEDQNKPVLVDIGRNIRTMIPSAFYVPQPVDGKIDESKILVGDDAEDMLDEDPDGYVIAIKKEIHKTGFKRLGGGRKIERVELASYLFRYVKEYITGKNITYFINRTIDLCVLTVPVNFSSIQREAIRQAAEKGGFSNIKIIEEPVAAACAWLAESHKKGIEYVIVCDIGGGTTDFAIVRFKNGIFQAVPEIPTKGFNWGGDDLDERILDRLHDQTEDSDDEEKQNYWQRITTNFRSAFKSRIRSIKEFFKKHHKEIHKAKIQDIELPIPQKEITSCVEEFVGEVCNELKTYLNQCYEKLNNKNIPVLLVGGSSQLSGLEEKVKSIAGEKNVYRWANSEYAIALGATLEGIDTQKTQTSASKSTSIEENTAEALWVAIKEGDLEKVKKLVNKGISVNAKNKSGSISLHFAARFNSDVHIMEYLVSKGAYINTKNQDGKTPLDYAIANNRIKIEDYLQRLHRISIFNAVREGNLKKVKELINAGADIHVKDKNGWSLMHYAARVNTNANILQYLVLQGAYVNVRDNDDWTPLHFAARLNSNIDILKYLISHGADINVKNKNGKTPLDYVPRYSEIYKYLEAYHSLISKKRALFDELTKHKDTISLLKDEEIILDVSRPDRAYVRIGCLIFVCVFIIVFIIVLILSYWNGMPLDNALPFSLGFGVTAILGLGVIACIISGIDEYNEETISDKRKKVNQRIAEEQHQYDKLEVQIRELEGKLCI